VNDFVNLKKRSIELPQGAKDLIDALRKCEYCCAPAVATAGFPSDYRWCEECQRDLNEFAKFEVPKGMLADTFDKDAIARYRAEMQRREEDFMRNRVKERKPQ
jgi:hypothetical protein